MRTRSTLFALLVVLASGCVNRFDAASLGVPATMASPAGQAPEGEPFKVNQTAIYMVAGLLPLSRPDLEKALARQLVGAQGVVDLRITVRSRLLDILVTGVTLGLIVPRTVTFEGTIVGGAPAGSRDP
ncbi:MAG TPA: hypothetical protein VLL51_04855 [Gemmatimonadales bacterium]|nr:hypothetical protein [Gemmatimonadales bacterium]